MRPGRALAKRPLDRPVSGLHRTRARAVRLVDLRDDEWHELAETPNNGIELDLAGTVGESLAEQPMSVGDVGHLRRRAELLYEAFQLQVIGRAQPEGSRVRRGEGAEQRRVGDIDREPQLRNALSPFLEIAPVAPDGREEDPPDPHSQHRWHVLDQRLDAVGEAGLGVEAKEALDVPIRGEVTGPVSI